MNRSAPYRLVLQKNPMKILLPICFCIMLFLTTTNVFCRVASESANKRKDAKATTGTGDNNNQNITLNSYVELVKHIQKSTDHLAAVLITTSNPECKKCDLVQQIFQHFRLQMKDQIKNFVLDCQEMWKQTHEREHFAICNPSRAQDLPTVTFFQPPLEDFDPYKKDLQRTPVDIPFKGNMSLETITQQAKNLMPCFRKVIETQKELTSFLNDHSIPLKAIFFSDSVEPPGDFKGITSFFRNRVDFAEVPVNNTELSEKLQVTTFPHLIFKKWNDVKKQYEDLPYRGSKRFESMRAFISPYALKSQKRRWKSQFEQIPNDTIHFIFSLEKIPNILIQNDVWVLMKIQKKVLAPPQNDEQKQQIESQFLAEDSQYAQLRKDYGSFFQYYVLTCQPDDLDCNTQVETTLGIKKWPSLVVFPFGPKTEQKYFTVDKDDTSKSLSEDLIDYIEITEKLIDDINFKTFIKTELQDEKIPIVWFYEAKDTYWKVQIHTLSNMGRFKKYLRFGRYPDPDQSSKKIWDFNQVPYVTAFVEMNEAQGKYQRAEFEYEIMNFDSIFEYLNQLSLKKESEVIERNTIDETNKMEEFDDKCVQPGRVCIIGFFNAALEKKFNIQFDHFQKLKLHFQNMQYSWVWIDGLCHQETLKKLRINMKDLPVLVYFDPKKLKFKIMTDQFQIQTAINFLKNIKKHKKSLIKLEEELDMDEKSCQKIRSEYIASLQQTQLDSDVNDFNEIDHPDL